MYDLSFLMLDVGVWLDFKRSLIREAQVSTEAQDFEF